MPLKLGILVFGFLFLLAFDSVTLDSTDVTAALEADRCDQPLNFRSKANG